MSSGGSAACRGGATTLNAAASSSEIARGENCTKLEEIKRYEMPTSRKHTANFTTTDENMFLLLNCFILSLAQNLELLHEQGERKR